MGDVNIDDKKYADLREFHYNYSNPYTPKGRSLWSEVANALSSIFSYLKDIFTREERTLLSEAITLGTGVNFDQYAIGKTIRGINTSELADLTVAHYDGVNLLE